MYLLIKYIFDKIFSLILTILLSPFLLLITLILFLFNDRDIFYLQNRVGFSNQTFKIIKFTTMTKDSEKSPDGSVVLRNDPRVTRIGRFLRITKLNELPQIFNILVGDMSFVGPRPLTKSGFELYTNKVQSSIYQSKPGITGISSIIFRDEEKLVSESSLAPLDYYIIYIFPYKGQLEQWYNENRSLWVDFIILFLTGFKIIVPKSNIEYQIFPSLPKSDHFKF